MSIRYSMTRTAAPGAVVTMDELKMHSRIDNDDEDALLDSLIRAAQDGVEDELGISTLTQTWVLRLDRFPVYEIRLPRPPLQSVSTLAYTDGNGDSQTLVLNTDYTVDLYGPTGRVVPIYGTSWPATQDVPAAVTITYVAGYTTVNLLPPAIYAGILRQAGLLYEHREEVVIGQIRTVIGIDDRLLANQRCAWEPEYH